MINIVNKDECTGCYACENICPKKCINMREDIEGFKYPTVDKVRCIECKKCINICPIINQEEVENSPVAYACYSKDEVVRSSSSSGGIFTLLSEIVINKNGVVFGAKFDDNFNVYHDYVDDLESLKYLRGSKYVQSNVDQSYKNVKKFLEDNRYVIFSGTPCQIGGLKSFLKRDYEKLICIDIICHGVPSQLAWNKYKVEISSGKKITNVNFRDKQYGWKSYSLKIDFSDGTSFMEKGSENIYMRGFLGDIYLRPSCYQCKFKTLHRQSDITLADFWGIENIETNLDDERGTSLIIVNTENGWDLLLNIKDKIIFKQVDLESSIKYNMSAIKSSYRNPRRDYFFKNIDRFKFDKLVKKSLEDSNYIKVKTRLYNMLKRLGLK